MKKLLLVLLGIVLIYIFCTALINFFCSIGNTYLTPEKRAMLDSAYIDTSYIDTVNVDSIASDSMAKMTKK